MSREPAKPQRQKRTLDSQRAFLEAFADACCVRRAAKAAGVAPKTHYQWLKNDAAYAAAFEEGKRAACDLLESVAVERASAGVPEPVYYKGKVCGHVQRYSDSLLMFLLRGMMPEKYGVRRQEISGSQRAPVQGEIRVIFVRPKPWGDSPEEND